MQRFDLSVPTNEIELDGENTKQQVSIGFKLGIGHGCRFYETRPQDGTDGSFLQLYRPPVILRGEPPYFLWHGDGPVFLASHRPLPDADRRDDAPAVDGLGLRQLARHQRGSVVNGRCQLLRWIRML